MSAQVDDSRPRGMRRVWDLTAQGYRIHDIDSDHNFVGVRLVRGSHAVTVLLTKLDFAAMFPRALDLMTEEGTLMVGDPVSEAAVDAATEAIEEEYDAGRLRHPNDPTDVLADR